jgi:hypothetical protein
MVPSVFVPLAALPLTAAGKIDRRALPPPNGQRPALETPFAAPRTPVEEALAVMWAEILRLDKVGVHDNFLELGVHSLLATQIAARVQERFGVGATVRALFEAPTVAEMAICIAQNQADRGDPGEIDRLLVEVEALSEEDARRLLTGEPGDRSPTEGSETSE